MNIRNELYDDISKIVDSGVTGIGLKKQLFILSLKWQQAATTQFLTKSGLSDDQKAILYEASFNMSCDNLIDKAKAEIGIDSIFIPQINQTVNIVSPGCDSFGKTVCKLNFNTSGINPKITMTHSGKIGYFFFSAIGKPLIDNSFYLALNGNKIEALYAKHPAQFQNDVMELYKTVTVKKGDILSLHQETPHIEEIEIFFTEKLTDADK